MKYFSSLLIILAIMAFGYAFGTLRYTTLGCRRAARWGRRRDRGLKTLLVVAIVPSTIAVVYGPTYHFHLWFGFEPDEALLFSVFWSLAAITLIGATIVRAWSTTVNTTVKSAPIALLAPVVRIAVMLAKQLAGDRRLWIVARISTAPARSPLSMTSASSSTNTMFLLRFMAR